MALVWALAPGGQKELIGLLLCPQGNVWGVAQEADESAWWSFSLLLLLRDSPFQGSHHHGYKLRGLWAQNKRGESFRSGRWVIEGSAPCYHLRPSSPLP